jgi:membrane-bound inhibitor of C-type lysozyme
MQHLITSIVSFGGLFLVMGSTDANEIQYVCADNTPLTVTFTTEGSGPGKARLTIAGVSDDITLPQVLSADGARYARDDMEFWVKGNSARLTRAGTAATTCHVK